MSGDIQQIGVRTRRDSVSLSRALGVVLALAVALLHLSAGLSFQFDHTSNDLAITDEANSHYAVEPRPSAEAPKPFLDWPPFWAIFGSGYELPRLRTSILGNLTTKGASGTTLVYFLSRAPPSLH